MPQVFNLTIFDEDINGTTTVYSSGDLAETLGQADQIIFQFHVTRSAGTSPTITVTYYHSNDGKYYTLHTTLLNAVSISTTPYDNMVVLGASAPLGGFGQVQITLGGTTPAAYVQVLACGRTT